MTPRVVHDELLRRAGEKIQVMDVGETEIKNLTDRIGHCDLILFDNSIILSMNPELLITRNFVLRNPTKGHAFYHDVWDVVSKSDKPVFLISPMSDLHVRNFGLSRAVFEDMIRRFSGIFWQYYRYPILDATEKNNYEFATLKPFNISQDEVKKIWNEITSAIRINIDLPNSVATGEYLNRNVKKKWDIIIPGAGYITRKLAMQSAVDSGVNIAPYQLYYKYLISRPALVLEKVSNKLWMSKVYQAQSLMLYKYMISRSSAAFVCGSELRYNVRKYWEIPIWKSAMLAYPTTALRDYGFINEQHYMETMPEEAGEKAIFLKNNRGFSERLISSAFDLVTNEHSVKNRVDQVIECLNLYLKGRLKGACYVNGKFEYF